MPSTKRPFHTSVTTMSNSGSYLATLVAVSQSVDLGRSNNPNTTPTKDYEMCEWWFTSTVSREDVLRRGRGDLHQQGDADRDAGYSWGTGVMEDEGDWRLDSS